MIAIGVDQAIKVSLATKEIVSEFRFNLQKIILSNGSEKQRKTIELYEHPIKKSANYTLYCAHVLANGNYLSTLIYKAEPREQIDLLEYK